MRKKFYQPTLDTLDLFHASIALIGINSAIDAKEAKVVGSSLWVLIVIFSVIPFILEIKEYFDKKFGEKIKEFPWFARWMLKGGIKILVTVIVLAGTTIVYFFFSMFSNIVSIFAVAFSLIAICLLCFELNRA